MLAAVRRVRDKRLVDFEAQRGLISLKKFLAKITLWGAMSFKKFAP
jgi:hypothetical protein